MMDDRMTSKPRRVANGAAGPQQARNARGSDSIAVGLQQLFASVADEPVPDEFMALLDRIDANERARSTGAEPTPVPGDGGGRQ
jgi:hypothetical protein